MVSGCYYLEKITIPYTVNKIGKKAFFECLGLRNVTFERRQIENLFIEDNCFEYCRELEKVTIPEKISLGKQVFASSSLKEIIIETDDESVGLNYERFGSYLKTYTDSNFDYLKGTLKIYVKNEAMKEKIKEEFKGQVKPENIIVGLPNENE